MQHSVTWGAPSPVGLRDMGDVEQIRQAVADGSCVVPLTQEDAQACLAHIGVSPGE